MWPASILNSTLGLVVLDPRLVQFPLPLSEELPWMQSLWWIWCWSMWARQHPRNQLQDFCKTNVLVSPKPHHHHLHQWLHHDHLIIRMMVIHTCLDRRQWQCSLCRAALSTRQASLAGCSSPNIKPAITNTINIIIIIMERAHLKLLLNEPENTVKLLSSCWRQAWTVDRLQRWLFKI